MTISLCLIKCLGILAHLFGLGQFAAKASNLPPIMTLASTKVLAERHHFLPDKMAVWRTDEAQRAFSNIPLALVGSVPLYTADVIC